MASTINASTSSGIVSTADTSGILQLQSNGTTVATFNSSGVNAGIQVASNAAPAFGVYQSSPQTLSSNTWTKIQFQTKEFDTANCFDATTNYRFTPNVAGYYQLNFAVTNTASATQILTGIYKNGSNFKNTTYGASLSSTSGWGSAIIYFNGSTDYVELYSYFQIGQATQQGQTWTWFNGAMIRSA